MSVAHASRHGRWEGMREDPAWRIIGGADGTQLAYGPYQHDGAPNSITRGELVVFFADAPFVVRSQDDAHPSYLGGTMTSASQCHDAAHGIESGGPFWGRARSPRNDGHAR